MPATTGATRRLIRLTSIETQTFTCNGIILGETDRTYRSIGYEMLPRLPLDHDWPELGEAHNATHPVSTTIDVCSIMEDSSANSIGDRAP
ncbi:MAG: hypothetical protein EB020_09710 [Proteobacteria bacterium]|nr:hypothetical protein [Pseudomonadota bacterium]